MILITEELRNLLRYDDYNNDKTPGFVHSITAARTINKSSSATIIKTDILKYLYQTSHNLSEDNHNESNSKTPIKSSLIGYSQDILLQKRKIL
jgi:thiamine phosphate synthase YjbQ (UPF0047 family)